MHTRKSTATVPAFLAAGFVGYVLFFTSACAAGKHPMDMSGLKQDFRKLDKDGNGTLSLKEFRAAGMDDLAFKAADANGDGRVDQEEFVNYMEAKSADESRSAQ